MLISTPTSGLTFGARQTGLDFQVPEVRRGMALFEDDIKKLKKEGIRPTTLDNENYDFGPDKMGIRFELRKLVLNATVIKLIKFNQDQKIAELGIADHGSMGIYTIYRDAQTFGAEIPKGRSTSVESRTRATKIFDSIRNA